MIPRYFYRFTFKEDRKCGGCNWNTDRFFVLASSEKEAKELLRKGEAGMCGRCFSDYLVDTGKVVMELLCGT